MEKNGILLERFPIGSQKATKVKKKKKPEKSQSSDILCQPQRALIICISSTVGGC